MEKTSLEDFLETDSGTTSDKSGRSDPSDDTTTTDKPKDDTQTDTHENANVESPTVTAAWSEKEAICSACGETTEWRWTQEGALVCPACKEW